MSDVEAIDDTMAEYVRLIDSRQLVPWSELFRDDGELDVDGHVVRGRAALVEFVREQFSRGPSTHDFEPASITIEGHAARAEAHFRLLAPGGQVITAGRVEDQWVREGDRWQLRRRRISLVAPPTAS